MCICMLILMCIHITYLIVLYVYVYICAYHIINLCTCVYIYTYFKKALCSVKTSVCESLRNHPPPARMLLLTVKVHPMSIQRSMCELIIVFLNLIHHRMKVKKEKKAAALELEQNIHLVKAPLALQEDPSLTLPKKKEKLKVRVEASKVEGSRSMEE